MHDKKRCYNGIFNNKDGTCSLKTCDRNEDGDFDVYILGEKEVKDVESNHYMKKLANNCYLNILQKKQVKKAYEDNKERVQYAP